jgi:hypothetical protein
VKISRARSAIFKDAPEYRGVSYIGEPHDALCTILPKKIKTFQKTLIRNRAAVSKKQRQGQNLGKLF